MLNIVLFFLSTRRVFSWIASSASPCTRCFGTPAFTVISEGWVYEDILERVPHYSDGMKTLVGKRIYDKFVLETNLLL